MDEYKEIDYYGTKVLVSKNGDVIWNGKMRNIYYNTDGYSMCAIKVPNYGWRGVSVARLVAMAYIPNPDNLPEVNHKDYNRTNANVNNLEWITHADNIRYSKVNRPDISGCKNPNYGNHKLSERYAKDKELSKQKQGRPGLQNGRCRKIAMYKNGVLVQNFNYIVECCKYFQNSLGTKSSLDAIRGGIDRSIRKNSAYRGYTFVKT